MDPLVYQPLFVCELCKLEYAYTQAVVRQGFREISCVACFGWLQAHYDSVEEAEDNLEEQLKNYSTTHGQQQHDRSSA